MQKAQYHIMAEMEKSHWWFLAKQNYIRALLPFPQGTLAILDIGCGTGGTSEFLDQWGSVTRLEKSSFAIAHLKKRKIPCIATSIERYSPGKRTFDMVCIFDVLYHKNIQSDQNVLNKSYALLRRNGIICITDCALPILFSHHDVVMEARTRYTRSEIIAKVESAGFRVHRASYTYFFVFPFILIQRLLSKFFQFETVSKMPSVANTLLLYICSFEAWLLRYTNVPIGSSLIILAQKI